MASSSILANSKLNLSKSLQLCIRTFRHTSASVPYDMDPAVFPLSARSTTLYGSLKMMTPSQAAKTEMDPLSGNGAAVDAPPAYSSSKKRMVEAPLTTFSCGFEAVTTDPDLYFSKYGRYSSNEQDCTIFLSASGLEDTDWLVATFLAQAKLPPKPMIRLKGTHKSAGTTVVDFNLCFDMTPFFLGDLHHLTLPADIPHNNSRDEVVVLLRRWAKSFQTSSDECKA